MSQSSLLEVLCLCDFSFFILLLSLLISPQCQGLAVLGQLCSNPAHRVGDGIVPQCDCSAGRCCLYRFQKRSKVHLSLPPSTLSLGPIHHSPGGTLRAFEHPVFPWLLAGLKGTGLLLHLCNKRLVCALYHCCQLLSINIYRFLLYSFLHVRSVYRGENTANKMVHAQTCHYPESEFLSPYLCAGLLWIGDFVTGFRARLWLFRKHPFNKSYGEQLPLSAEPRHIR